jgi:hypothetical protein
MCCCNESEYGYSIGGTLASKGIKPLVTKMEQGKIKPKHLKWFLGLTIQELDELVRKTNNGPYCGKQEIF